MSTETFYQIENEMKELSLLLQLCPVFVVACSNQNKKWVLNIVTTFYPRIYQASRRDTANELLIGAGTEPRIRTCLP